MEKTKEKNKQNLLTGAGVLAIATVVVKLISALYKIPLTNLITVEGYAYFTGAYAIYNPLYAISMAGLPVAVSKLVSQNIQEGRMRDAKEIFHVARRLFLVVGIFGTVILAAVAVPYSKMVSAPMNYVSILFVAPCILFCCQMSSFRGYYEGMNNMIPTGVSQVIEAAIKLIFGLAATYFLFSKWLNDYRASAVDGVGKVFGVVVNNEAEALNAIYPYAAAVAIFGVTLGSMFGLLFLVIMNRKNKGGFTEEELSASPEPKSRKELRNTIIKIAIPISITSVVSYLSNIIDDVTIRTRLAVALEKGSDVIKEAYAASFAQAQTLDEGIKNYLYGTHGSVLNIKNLIPTITLTLGISAIPVLSKVWTKMKEEGKTEEAKKELKTSIETVLRVVMLVALPAGLGIAALAEPILRLLYSSQPDIVPIAAPMLRVYGFGMFLFAVSSPVISMLQAIGRTDIPLKSIAVGSALKIALNYVLIAIPEINIHGAPISTTCCYIVMLSYNMYGLVKYTEIRPNIISVFVKPLVSAAVCGLGAFASYWLLYPLISMPQLLGEGSLSNMAATVVSVGVGGILYLVFMFLLKGFAKEDILMLPKGNKIAKTLEKLHVLG